MKASAIQRTGDEPDVATASELLVEHADGSRCHGLPHPHSVYAEPGAMVASTGRPVEGAERKRADELAHLVQETMPHAQPMGDTSAGSLVSTSSTDPGTGTQADARLQRTLAELAQRNRDLQDFALFASHDLQEPLRKIQTFSALVLSQHAQDLDLKARDYLERSCSAAAHMQDLIDDLLAYSRIATHAGAMQCQALASIVGPVLQDFDARLQACGALLEVGDLPTTDGDAGQLRQLFHNLFANALKFRAPRRTPPLRVTAKAVALAGDQRGWAIRVEDNGIGFEPQYAQRIFAPFTRLHGRQQYEGTGIGLAIARRIAERHHGSIVAEGRPGTGAVFVVTLPEQQPPPLVAPAKTGNCP